MNKMAKCPGCKTELTIDSLEKEKKGVGLFKQEILYSCPHCKVIIGISRGKWSG